MTQVRGSGAALPEDLDIGVPEAVDRLELVTDREHLGQLRMRDQVDDLALKRVRVLELVDHEEAEAKPDRVAHLLRVAKKISGGELKILEVDRRLATFRSGVLVSEALEQVLEQVAVMRGQLFQCRAFDRLPRELVRRRARPSSVERREIDDTGSGGAGHRAQRFGRRGSLARGCGLVRGKRDGLLAKGSDRLRERRTLPELQHEISPGGAQRLVDPGEHAPQAVSAIGGEELQPLLVATRAELLERALKRLSTQDGGTRILELPEPSGRGRLRRDAPSAAGCRSRESWRSRRRPARARDRAGPARRKRPECANAARRPPSACT